MKIRYASDIHLEFFTHNKLKPKLFDIIIPPTEGDDETVLILAGDIHTGEKAKGFVEYLSQRFKAIIYVPGNHEYYRQSIDLVDSGIASWEIPNVHFLNPGTVEIGGVKFVGATMWTDFNNHDPIAASQAQMGMNDFVNIRYNNFKQQFNFEEWLSINVEHQKFLLNNVEEGCVVVTHHAPHPKSIAEKFRYADSLTRTLNHAYHSDMTTLIEKSKPALWVHGHVHNENDYMVENTRIVSNPYGYHNYEVNKKYKVVKVLEI